MEYETSTTAKIEQIIETMTIEEKLGQMIMVGFKSEAVNDDVRRMLHDYKIGNLILYERNIRGMRPWNWGSAEKPNDKLILRNLVTLTNSLQSSAASLERDTSRSLPLLIAVDQENGSVMTVEKGITELPGALSIGQTRDANLAYEAGLITGSELRAVGINMNLAPVLDVDANTGNDIINDRAFGGHPDIVTPLAVAFMEGLHAGGVISVPKHFPGHGESSQDPHFGLPKTPRLLNDIRDINLPPFKAAIQSGARCIMTAHIYFEHLTSQKDLPFSMDKKLEQLLRTDLGFDGVILGDDLTRMRAAVNDYRTLETAMTHSIDAGTDIIMLAHFYLVGFDKFDGVFRFPHPCGTLPRGRGAVGCERPQDTEVEVSA